MLFNDFRKNTILDLFKQPHRIILCQRDVLGKLNLENISTSIIIWQSYQVDERDKVAKESRRQGQGPDHEPGSHDKSSLVFGQQIKPLVPPVVHVNKAFTEGGRRGGGGGGRALGRGGSRSKSRRRSKSRNTRKCRTGRSTKRRRSSRRKGVAGTGASAGVAGAGGVAEE